MHLWVIVDMLWIFSNNFTIFQVSGYNPSDRDGLLPFIFYLWRITIFSPVTNFFLFCNHHGFWCSDVDERNVYLLIICPESRRTYIAVGSMVSFLIRSRWNFFFYWVRFRPLGVRNSTKKFCVCSLFSVFCMH